VVLAPSPPRGRIARQLVTESVLLTAIAAAVGLVVGYAALQGLGALSIQELPRGAQIHFDAVTTLYALGIAALVGVVLGLVPVAAVLPANLNLLLREEGRSGTAGRSARLLRRGLVVAQVAVAFVLLIGAGLLLASFERVLAVDPGFDPAGIITTSVSLPRTRYANDDAIRTFMREALGKIRALPGVQSAGITTMIPFGDNHDASTVMAEGYQMQPGESLIAPNQVQASPGYLETMKATLLRGRFFDEHDTNGARKVVIVDDRLARKFWPDRDPIGGRLYQPEDINGALGITDKTEFYTVVGVVKEMTLQSLAQGNQAVGAYIMPVDQVVPRGMTFAVRSRGGSDPAQLSGAIRTAVQAVDPNLPVFATETMTQLTEKSLVSRRSPMLLAVAFGVVALFLSAIGIYGVLAYLVIDRRKELGIRLALGGSPRSIFELVLREGMVLIAAGLAIGALGVAALRTSLETQLFGVNAADPAVIGIVAAILAVVAIAACAIPARRATRIDPVVALAE
jgi:putative ABC transport system permease protein